MNLIAAVDNNWAIGLKGELLVSIPADQKRFRNETINKVVVLGRKTMDTFPGGRPLKNRRNIILSRNPNYEVRDAEVVHNVEELLELVKDVNTEDVYIIGGESIYREFLPYCDRAYITKINYTYQSDAYFPNLDKDDEWEMVNESEEETYYDLDYTYRLYERKKK